MGCFLKVSGFPNSINEINKKKNLEEFTFMEGRTGGVLNL